PSRPGRLYRACSHLAEIASPTLLPTPWPNGPVVISTPEVWRYSGCPGVLLSSWRKLLRSSSVTAGRSRPLYSESTVFTPVRYNIEYNSIEAWPFERMNRSRFGQTG